MAIGKLPQDEKAMYSCMLRGLVITQMAGLEKALDTYLSNYFTADTSKQLELFELLLDRMTFDGKRTAFEAILKKNHTPAEYKKNYKGMIEDLRKLIVKRNQFAHFIFDEHNEIKGNVYHIGLMEFRNAVNTIWYSEEDVAKIGNDSNALMNKIYDMAYKQTEGKRF